MGLTPVEGLMMGTRCGDVDPAALLYIQEKEHLDNAGMQKLINKQSGLTGISGISSDMRDIDAAIAAGNERARLALDMYRYRIVKYVGAYTAALGGVDVIVFTAGVGETRFSCARAYASNWNFSASISTQSATTAVARRLKSHVPARRCA